MKAVRASSSLHNVARHGKFKGASWKYNAVAKYSLEVLEHTASNCSFVSWGYPQGLVLWTLMVSQSLRRKLCTRTFPHSVRWWRASHTHQQPLLLNNVLEDFNRRWEEDNWLAFMSLQVPNRSWEWLPTPSPSSDPAAIQDGPTWLIPIQKTHSYDRDHGGLQGSPAQPSLCPQFPHTLPGECGVIPTYISVSMAMLTVSYPKGTEFKVSSPLP